MAIYREVSTEVYCDICGEKVIGWNSVRNGVSKIWIAAAAGVTVVALFALLTSREQQQEHKNADKRQQAEPLVIEVPEQATEGSIRVFDYDGCCIYAYYGKIEIRNDGRDGKEIDIVCAGYLEGYEEHKEPDETGEREAEHE